MKGAACEARRGRAPARVAPVLTARTGRCIIVLVRMRRCRIPGGGRLGAAGGGA